MAKENFVSIVAKGDKYSVNGKVVDNYKSYLLTDTEAKCLEQFQKSGIRLISSTYWTP